MVNIYSYQLEKLVNTVPDIHNAAKEAYKGYIRTYVTHTQKKIFNVKDLDLKKVAMSFGLVMPPYVNICEFFFNVFVYISLCKSVCYINF